MITIATILQRLNAIAKKIEENTHDVWEDSLDDTKSVAILEDFTKGSFDDAEELKYNGWATDLDKLRDDLHENLTPKKIYFIFGETPCRDIDDMTEEEFVAEYGSEGTESCYPFEYTEGVTTPFELLGAMNGSFDYAQISEELYNKL